MAAYKTPGVYIEEIVKFPPSVAQVETAIPAFIGYTQKATKKEVGDLSGKPTRITSMLEYEAFFGQAKKETTLGITVTDKDGARTISVTPPPAVSKSPFLLYYSLQMYFANGGGPCYIVSVGQYDDTLADDKKSTTVALDNLKSGLDAIKKVDEPTLLLFPDATSLSPDTDFYAIYDLALQQCNELQDRFTIIDTFSDEEHETKLNDSEGQPYLTIDPDKSIRQGIALGKNFLKYGAVYYPFLETILDYQYDETKLVITHESDDSQALKDQIKVAEDANKAMSDLKKDETSAADLTTLIDSYGDAAAAKTGKADTISAINDVISSIDGFVNAAIPVVAATTTAAAASSEDAPVSGAATTAATNLSNALTPFGTLKSTLEGHRDTISSSNVASTIESEGTSAKTAIASYDTDVEGLISLLEAASTAITNAQKADTDGHVNGKKLNEVASLDNAMYNSIKQEINAVPIKLPPSSTMAGIYARVDSDRGVWKAPANVGLSYVTKPSVAITHEEQQDLNVDTVAGKSINAIRSFTGKGVLVWGARTLAGNDLEWRYISVRRFFNMAEESIKKATEQFVFEPNDKNTWVRVKAMITNFLTAQWRAGALAGPTPEKAFYVNIGLGETMTAVDILEGNMIVEIGMAVVRPAEFIILKFSHKMQEA